MLIQQAYETLRDKLKRSHYDSQFQFMGRTTSKNPYSTREESRVNFTEEEINEYIRRYEENATWRTTPNDYFKDGEHAKKRYNDSRQRMEQILREQELAESRRRTLQPIFFWVVTAFFAVIFVINVYLQFKMSGRKKAQVGLTSDARSPVSFETADHVRDDSWNEASAQSLRRRQIYDMISADADKYADVPATKIDRHIGIVSPMKTVPK